MAGCIPKHVACDWYIPEFIAGPTGCTLPNENENRSRILDGGTLFRSIGVGLSTNNIQIRIALGSDDVTLEVAISNVVQETHTVAQNLGSPIINGIPPMRVKLNTDSNLITMPPIDVQSIGTGSTTVNDIPYVNIWDASIDDGDFLSSIGTLTNLSGGLGMGSDTGTLDSIRTGPAYTMTYIDQSELDTLNDTGAIFTLGDTRYWNGACWKTFDPTVADCAGSPPDCGTGPEGDCP